MKNIYGSQQATAELHVNFDGVEVVYKIGVNTINVHNDVQDVTRMGSNYREYIPVGPSRITLEGFLYPQPTPLSDKDWATVSAIVAASGQDAVARAERYAVGIRHGWLTAQDIRRAEGLDPQVDTTPVPTFAFFTAEDWATVDTIARDTITALRERQLDEFLANNVWD